MPTMVMVTESSTETETLVLAMVTEVGMLTVGISMDLKMVTSTVETTTGTRMVVETKETEMVRQ